MKTGSPIYAFTDCETTSLRPDRRAWEIAVIRRYDAATPTRHHWFVDLADLDLGNADLTSLGIGGFFDRHPQLTGTTPEGAKVAREAKVMAELEAVIRGAHLIGAVVSFDAETYAAGMRRHGICPSWHYHVVDVEALAVGYLAAAAGSVGFGDSYQVPGLPWDSDELSSRLAIETPTEDRHTAVGDTKWAMAIWDAVHG